MRKAWFLSLSVALFAAAPAEAHELFKYVPQAELESLEAEAAPSSDAKSLERFEDIEAWVNKDLYLASGYQQQSYALRDIQGDVSLVLFARTNMLRIKLMLKKDEEGIRELVRLQRDGYERYKDVYKQWSFNQLDPAPLDLRLTEERIQSLPVSEESKELLRETALDQVVGFELTSKPFHAKQVVNMLRQVIHEERASGIEPSRGTEHRFAPEMYQYYKSEFPVLRTGMTKIFMALGNGLTFRFMVTGQEEALSQLIEARDYESVSLEEAFRLSYRLNRGDLYLTFLTLENLFAYHWTNPERDRVSVVQRLKPFTHYFNKGDKFGHWYHFWGMVLYGHLRGSVRAATVGGIEEILSRLAGGEASQENQEGLVNVYAGIVGGRISKTFNARFKPNPEYLSEAYYLEPMDLDRAIRARFK